MLTAHLGSLDEIFSLNSAPENWKQKLLGSYFRTAADATRNQYMAEIYANVTINLSHLAATLIMYCVENAYSHIRCQRFFNALYIAVKRLQQQGKINLHRSLLNPHDYNDLLSGTNNRFAQFICVAKNSSLITEENDSYHFLPKLLEESSFDDIRLENLIAVYNNEAEPIKTVRNILIAAFEDAGRIEAEQLLNWYLDDEYRDLSWERHVYSKPRYNDINRHETANAEPLPFFLKPGHTNGVAVLLIHGLLASPAELRAYGEHLEQMGYTVLAVRLKGHGSSPYALRNTTWEDWYASVIRGFEILRQQGDRIFVTGFSTGGALALKLVSEHHPEIIGVCGVSLPVRFINPAFMLVPLLHGTNKLIDFLSVFEGVKPFLENDQEHPFINYRHVPVKALYELRQLIHNMEESVAACQCPVLIMHGDDDPVVSVKSADVVMGKLKTTDKRLTIVPATRHGILMENISGTWASIDQFMTSCQGQ
jgi:esterase/lipase